jgi:cobalt-zinc-cadmium efflux system outer membrane protein
MTFGSVLLLVGCASLDPSPKVEEAMDLAGKRTGQRPDWTAPWSEDAPAWADKPVLLLDEALFTALRENRQLRADLEMIGQANADLVQAGLLSNPVINFMVMFPSGGGRAMLRSSALPMQPLADLWLIPARTEVATAQLQQAVLRVADRAVETAAEVKKSYAEIQYTQRAIELIRENMELVNQSTSIIEIRQASGKASRVEVNISRIRHDRLQSDLLAMQALLSQKKHELLAMMGRAEASEAWRVEHEDEAKAPVDAPPPEEQVVLLAADQRLDLKAMQWTTESALRRIKLTRREGWPDLAVGFSFERAPGPRSAGPSARARAFDAAAAGLERGLAIEPAMPSLPRFSPRARLPREVKYTLGPMIEMELPIFDWNQAQTAKAMHEYQQRLAEYDGLLQSVVRDVRQTLVRQAEAHDQLVLFREVILPQVEGNLELAREAYIAAQTDLTIYLQAQEDAISTRIRMLEFLRDHRIRVAELERAVGGRLILSPPGTPPTGAGEHHEVPHEP